MQSSDKKYSGLRLGIFALLSASAIIAAVAVYLTTGKTFDEVAEEAAAERQAAFQEAAGEGVGPSFDVVRISRGGTGVIAGRAAPGSSVEVYADDQLVGTATADQNGEWVMILEEPLESGPAELSILAKREGEEATESENIVVVSVPDRPDEDRFLEETGDGVVAVLTPRDGVGASRILQRPGAGPVGEIGDSLAIETLDYAPDGSAYMSGRGLPRAQVRVYLDNRFLGSTKTDDDGRWVFQPETDITAGPHVLRLDQVVSAGEVELRIEQPFETGLPLDTAAAQGSVYVHPGNTLWHIARRIYGSGVRYTMIFRENSEQIRDPDLIYPGQVFKLPDRAENGAASVQP